MAPVAYAPGCRWRRRRAHMAAANAQIYAQIEKDLLNYVERADLPMPGGRFVRVLHALSDGLMVCRFLEPENYGDEVIVSAFEALAQN